MKKTDIALLILIAGIGVLISFFIARQVWGDPAEESKIIRTAIPITSEVVDPDPRIFYEEALNPTVEVIIGGDVWCTLHRGVCVDSLD